MQIDNVEEQRKIKEDLIQNTEEVEKVLAIREEMDAKQELKSKYAKRSVETTSGVERLQLRVAIESWRRKCMSSGRCYCNRNWMRSYYLKKI